MENYNSLERWSLLFDSQCVLIVAGSSGASEVGKLNLREQRD